MLQPSYRYEQEKYRYVYVKNREDQLSATSGGAFFLLADYILQNGGVVCGCVWDENFVARHIVADNIDDVKRMRGSKYVQSDMQDCFQVIKELIKEKPVLFTGTPCQTTALHGLIGDHKNLFLCALVCGGAPSPLVWKKYSEALEQGQKSRLVRVNHRSKKNGWLCLTIEAEFANGKKVYDPMVLNPYAYAFFSGLTTNTACVDCKFTWGKFYADMLIADAWGAQNELVKKSKNLGMSAFLSLSHKGEAMWTSIQERAEYADCPRDEFKKGHPVLYRSKKPNPNRATFFKALDKKDIVDNLKVNTPVRRHAGVNRFLNAIGLYGRIFTLLKKH